VGGFRIAEKLIQFQLIQRQESCVWEFDELNCRLGLGPDRRTDRQTYKEFLLCSF
jgi:hypothetical protein